MGKLGLESGTVRLAAYDSAWPELYAAEAARLQPFLAAQNVALLLEHSGSTSVPGLCAKPIIDILAGRKADEERPRIIAAITAAGYVYRGEQGIPGRDFFRLGDPRQYHLHLTTVGSAFWYDHRTFRDFLRAHPDAADQYAAVKQELALRFPFDRESYINGKTAFVESVLARARQSTVTP
jgi:GrpB-like predicted nucleotidyltransferase (UPF0157 family)